MITATPEQGSASAGEAAPDRLPPGSTTLLTVLVAAAFAMVLNETILTTALPRLMSDFQLSAATAQWLTTGFILVMAIVTPATGFLQQRFSTRTMFLAAVGLFVAGTLIALLSSGFTVLMIARVIQALGTAAMLPMLTTTIMQLVPASQRGKYIGLIVIVMATAPAAGPPLSGIIVESLGWRGIFAVLLPVGVLSLVFGAVKLRNLNTPVPSRIDGWSLLLAAFAFGGLIYGLSSIGEGHSVIPPWIPLLAGVIMFAAFVARQVFRERNGAAPLLNLRPFTKPSFTLGVTVMAVAVVVQAGTMTLLPLFMQGTLGISSKDTGLLMLPGGLAMTVLALPVGHLYDRIGARPLLIPGATALSVSLFAIALMATNSPSPLLIAAAYLLANVGLALTMTPVSAAALSTLPSRLYPHGSSIISTVQPLSAAIAVALFISVMSSKQDAQLALGDTMQAAGAAGVHNAFLTGAILSLTGVLAACFIRRPTRT
jgi:DHA2 family lincomycin resistance protein-like MFS transporter